MANPSDPSPRSGPLQVRRRALLAGAGAVVGTAVLSRAVGSAAGAESGPLILEAKPGMATLLEPPEPATPIWGYAGAVPGPVIRARRGGEVWVRLKNGLPDATTIHWHGIRIDNRMDGVAHLTQAAVPPGETFDYRFTVPDAGTFWYHPHHLSWEQVARGLYGALIVEENQAPDVDQDLVLIADDWRLKDDGKIDEGSFDSLHDRSHAGRLGNVLTMNGQPFANITVASGERNRLRLINTCNARILTLQFEETAPVLIALDGQPVPPAPLPDGKIRIAPAQRADLVIDMTGAPGTASAIAEVSQGRLVAGHFRYHPSRKVERERGSVILSENGIPLPDLSAARAVDLVMEGGAMGRLQTAVYKGEKLSLGEMARKHGQVWSFNGVAGMPQKPLFSVKRGQPIALRMVNDTRWPHAMHIHGHHFREIREGAPWRDTILVDVAQTRTLAFVADNPGKWMIHCHMLEHQAGGMGTWFEVTA